MSDQVVSTPDEITGESPAVTQAAAERPLADLTARLGALLNRYASDSSPHSADAATTVTTSASVARADASQSDVTAVAPPNSGAAEIVMEEEVCERIYLPDDALAARIMIVDDEEVNILALQRHLTLAGYQEFIVTTQPRNAMDLLRERMPDVLVLDIRMPQISGLDILSAKRQEPALAHIPVIILTASTDPEIKRKALELGAHDFLAKPLDPTDLIPRIKNAITAKKHFDEKAQQAVELERLVRSRTAELEQSRHELVLSLARAAEHRDNETGYHVLRVGRYAGLIAREVGWSDVDVEMLELAAQLHDVGKIGVPDSILFKPGRLDAQEYEIIKKHCAWGKEIIEPLSDQDARVFRSHTRIGDNILRVRGSQTLLMASKIAQTHHENWDGTGYPMGLAKEDIPIEGRITAIADVFDALSTRRPYKKPFPRERCFEVMAELRGKKFDPRLLDCFFARTQDIVATQLELMDRSFFCEHPA
jgi:putative two-component system response regulator